MKKHFVILASAAALLLTSMAWAQQQYDSLGSPTPAPKQNASPNATGSNVPQPAGKAEGGSATTGKAETSGSGFTAGSGTVANPPSDGRVNGPVNSGVNTPTDSGATPRGLVPD